MKKIKSNLHYTRGITPKRVTSGGAHLRNLAPGLHSSEETWQRWRTVGDTVPIWPAWGSNPRPPAPIACAPIAPDGRCFPVARSVTLSTLFNLADRNRICLNGETPNDVQAGQRQTSFSGRGDAHLRRTVNKFQRPSILQLNIEGLTASKMSVLHHLALQCEALVILLQETHCTSVERLDLPSYHLAGFSLSRKHGLATFVHERLKWILIDQSPPTSEIEWVCVDVDNYKIVNVYKPPPTRMQASDLPAFPHPCLYAGDFNCHHVDWGYNNNNPDGECLAGQVPTTSPCYIAPRRPPVSILAAGKQTPTQILHLPVSIWTVAYLTDVS